ncbi:Uncharacterised protein r2_g1705 [Pycnogonum litorale]
MVPKEDGSWRPCGDYRRLNVVTEPDRYPLPNMADLTSYLHGAKVFTKLDLLKGYFQIPVYPDDVEKTAIITPFGTYVFSHTTFGLRNAGATFQRMMDEILGDLPYCAYYVDDILIYSRREVVCGSAARPPDTGSIAQQRSGVTARQVPVRSVDG